MQFTNKCAGDLGIAAEEPDLSHQRVVAMMFVHYSGHTVFDIVQGGHPVICETEADALNVMLAIATREESK